MSLKGASIEQVNKLFLHVLVDVTVASEGLAALLVSTEGADEIRVFDFLVEIANEGASLNNLIFN